MPACESSHAAWRHAELQFGFNCHGLPRSAAFPDCSSRYKPPLIFAVPRFRHGPAMSDLRLTCSITPKEGQEWTHAPKKAGGDVGVFFRANRVIAKAAGGARTTQA